MEEEAAVGWRPAHTQDHACVEQEEVGSMKLLGWERLTAVERGVDGDMPLLLPSQEVVLAAAVAAVVAAGVLLAQAQAVVAAEAVRVALAVATVLVAEVGKGEAEWTEPISQSVKHKINA